MYIVQDSLNDNNPWSAILKLDQPTIQSHEHMWFVLDLPLRYVNLMDVYKNLHNIMAYNHSHDNNRKS